MEDFENPYQPPRGAEPDPDAIPSRFDDDFEEHVDPRKIGKARYVRTVAVLLIIHGVLMLVAGFGLIGLMAFITPQLAQQIELQQQAQRQQNPNAPQLTKEALATILYVVYGVFSAFLFLLGILDLYAGMRNYGYRSRTLGVISIVANMGSILFCWCLPFSIGLLIFGMIVYLSPEADRAFRWRSRYPQQR